MSRSMFFFSLVFNSKTWPLIAAIQILLFSTSLLAANLLDNAGFEQGSNSWSGIAGDKKVQSSVVGSGSSAVEIKVSSTQWNVFSQLVSVKPGETLKLRVNLKTQGLSGGAQFRYQIRWNNSGSWISYISVGANQGWSTISKTITAPSNATSALVTLGASKGSGLVYIDDAAIESSLTTAPSASTPTPTPNPTPAPSPTPTPTVATQLFNGVSLNGLYTWLKGYGYNDPNNVFSVQNGLLKISGNSYGGILTNNSYSNYHLVVEFKWGTKTFGKRSGKARDGGILVHANGVDGGTIGVIGGRWKAGLQAQILEGGMGDLVQVQGLNSSGKLVSQSMTIRTKQVACVYDNWGCWYGLSSTPVYSSSGSNQTFTGWDLVHNSRWDSTWQDVLGFRGKNDLENTTGKWNQMVMIADGGTVTVYFNGIVVNQATSVYPNSGQILIQSELAEMYIRKWELWPLGKGPTPVNPNP